MPKTIPVLVIEDNRLVREGIAAMLAGEQDLEVVGAVDGAAAALREAREAHPRVVLLDAGLGDHDSHRLVASVRQTAPDARIIVMYVLPVPEDVVEFIKAGASGFIAEDATRDDFLGAVRSVAAGTEVLPRALTGTLFSHIADRRLHSGVRELRRSRRRRVRGRPAGRPEQLRHLRSHLRSPECDHRLRERYLSDRGLQPRIRQLRQ